MNKEIVDAIKETKTIDELKEVAIKNGYNLTDEQANNYFTTFHTEGKISDEELNNVSGGACSRSRGGSTYSGKDHHRLIVTIGNHCELFKKNPDVHLVTETCLDCIYMDQPQYSLTCYCKRRTWEDDPLNHRYI